jgi:hypothetical protein
MREKYGNFLAQFVGLFALDIGQEEAAAAMQKRFRV